MLYAIAMGQINMSKIIILKNNCKFSKIFLQISCNINSEALNINQTATTNRVNDNVGFRTVCTQLTMLYKSHQCHTKFTDAICSLWPTKFLVISIFHIAVQQTYIYNT